MLARGAPCPPLYRGCAGLTRRAIRSGLRSRPAVRVAAWRWIYVGAGTSGRIAALDAAECQPTFGVPPDRVVALIAGGDAALTRSVEGAEDDRAAAVKDLEDSSLDPGDVVVGLAAREGDSVAEEIWAIAAREVAQTATAALGRVFAPDVPVSVSWTGNLFDARDLMLQPFQQQVAVIWPKARLLAPRGTALSGAELLACSNPPHMFDDLLHVFES